MFYKNSIRLMSFIPFIPIEHLIVFIFHLCGGGEVSAKTQQQQTSTTTTQAVQAKRQSNWRRPFTSFYYANTHNFP